MKRSHTSTLALVLASLVFLVGGFADAYAQTPAAPPPAASKPSTADAPAPATPDLATVLDYDWRAPITLKVVTGEMADGVVVQDVIFGGAAEPIRAYIVRPAGGPGPFAGVLFVHWYSPESKNSNATQFLDEARALARAGTVSLLVSTFWSDNDRYAARRWQTDLANTVAQTRELRRALDVLVAQPGVDPARIAYVGHDYGAMFGALVAAVDKRPKAYVLVAGAPRFSDWYLFGSASGVPRGEALEAFKKSFEPIDPITVIPRARAALFFQYGESDRYTPRGAFLSLYIAAPATGKRLATYFSDHAMESRMIYLDRAAWLAEQLGLPPPQ